MTDPPTVVAPTLLEYVLARAILRGRAVVRSGIGPSQRQAVAGPVVVCGLAGGLDPSLRPGTIVIAQSVGTGEDDVTPCDEALVARLMATAKRLGHEPRAVRLLTATTMVTGAERSEWNRRGFQAVDMETAHWRDGSRPLTSLRVIIDTPDRELSDAWLRSGRAMLQPRLWKELVRLAATAPRYAIKAARLVRETG